MAQPGRQVADFSVRLLLYPPAWSYPKKAHKGVARCPANARGTERLLIVVLPRTKKTYTDYSESEVK